MRKTAMFTPALLAACAANTPTDSPGPPQATPVHGETPGHTCNAAGTERFIGQAGTSKTGAAIKRATNAAVLRWAPPGYAVTMDYRADRVTIWLGDDNKIKKINCG